MVHTFVRGAGTGQLLTPKKRNMCTTQNNQDSQTPRAQIRNFQNLLERQGASEFQPAPLTFELFIEVLKHKPSSKESLHAKPRAPGSCCAVGIFGERRGRSHLLNGIKQRMKQSQSPSLSPQPLKHPKRGEAAKPALQFSPLDTSCKPGPLFIYNLPKLNCHKFFFSVINTKILNYYPQFQRK